VRSGIRIKLFIAFFTLIVISLLITAVVLSQYLKESLVSRIGDTLTHHAALGVIAVQSAPEPFDTPRADRLADRLGEAASARVTIIRKDGTVIGDSQLSLNEVKTIENHGDREEIRAALATGHGSVMRFSTTQNRHMLYVARVYERPEGRGVVRVSKAVAEMTEAVQGLRNVLVLACLIGLLTAAIMSGISSHLLSRRLRRLVRFAEALVSGQHKGHLDVSSRDEIGGLAGSLNEMSRRLQASLSQVAEQRDQFEAVLDGMNEAVLALDENGYVALINRAGAMLLGITGEPTGKMLLETVRLPALYQLAEGVDDASDEVAEFDIPGSPQRTILAKATPLRNGGVVIVLRDVSELRRLERVRRDFVSNVSHELRTPVSIIQANAETLQDGGMEDAKAAVRFLESITANAKRLSNLISDLLDISRIEEGQYALNIEPLAVGLSLRRAAAALETKAIERELTIKVENAGEIRVNADVRALDQILFNLLDNAVKYSGRGGRVVIRAEEEKEDTVRIEVEDNGPGVEPKFRDRLFERFFRVDKGRSRAMGGTGLGLAIVKHLVQAMSGKVGMTPAIPNGSVFWFSLPRSGA
jgi:two-component system phosphate regulon sensor histidine kinase PhoR